MSLYDLEDIQANLANWADRLQANIDILNTDTQRRQLVTLGETVAAFSTAYIKASDGKAYNAKGVSGMLPVIGVANEAGILNDQIRLVTFGVVTNPSWTWTPQTLLIASSVTAGLPTEAPALLTIGSQEYNQVVAIALTATSIFVCPSPTYRMDFKPAPYTAAGKPSTGDFAGQEIFITDAGTTGRKAYWGIDNAWHYIKDDSAV